MFVSVDAAQCVSEARVFRVCSSSVRNFGYAAQNYGLTVGGVVAVRSSDAGGAEVDIAVTNDKAWSHLADGHARVHVGCSFTGAIGPDPVGGKVQKIEIT